MRLLLPLLLCACASAPIPIPDCDAAPEPLTGFLGVAKYPPDLDESRAVYCGCAVSCAEYGPTVTGSDLATCMYSVPEGCATRAVFCEQPDEGGTI